MSARSFGVLVAVVMVAALVIAMPPASAATTLFVDGSAGCDDTDGIPFYCTIQAAIDDAIDGDTISIAAGTYTGSGNSVAVIDNKDLTVVGAGQGLTLISGSDTRRGLMVINSSVVAVSDLSIIDGGVNDSGGAISVGGGASLDLTDVTVRDSVSPFDGGGIFVASNLDLLRVTISNNTASNGGGLSLDYGAVATITDSVFSLNDAGNSGGGIASYSTGGLTITGTRFDTNTATLSGGGIYMNAAVAVTDTRFTGNSAANGGGMYTQAGFITIDRSLFDGNTASTDGGGLFHSYTEFSTDLLRVINTTFFDNEATAGSGGGAYADGFFINTTFAGNSAGDDGGGLARNVFSTVNVGNSVFADNTAGDAGPECYGVWSEGHNLVQSDPGGNCIQAGDVTGNLVGVDPFLLPLAGNGGPTMTMALPLGSPARNAGNPDPSDATDWSGYLDEATGDWSCAATDQRSVDRDDQRCDMGASELDRVIRYAGANRYATAAVISAGHFPGGATKVFIATGLNFPDALAGAAIANLTDAPLLLVNSSGVPAETAAALTRLNPTDIVILGGNAAIPDAVKTTLDGYGTTTRVSGANRYLTAIAISQYGFPTDGTADTVFVATGLNFPDALAAGPAAAALNGPVLLVPGNESDLPQSVADEILRLDPSTIVVVGGTGAVSNGIYDDLDVLQGSDTVTRVFGATRYITAVNISDYAFGAGADLGYITTGLNFPDALAGAAAALDSPILLVPGTDTAVPAAVESELVALGAAADGTAIILGGTGVVSLAIETDLGTIFAS